MTDAERIKRLEKMMIILITWLHTQLGGEAVLKPLGDRLNDEEGEKK